MPFGRSAQGRRPCSPGSGRRRTSTRSRTQPLCRRSRCVRACRVGALAYLSGHACSGDRLSVLGSCRGRTLFSSPSHCSPLRTTLLDLLVISAFAVIVDRVKWQLRLCPSGTSFTLQCSLDLMTRRGSTCSDRPSLTICMHSMYVHSTQTRVCATSLCV